MTEPKDRIKDAALVAAARETQALIEEKISSETGEIQQKVGELIELIKDRASSDLARTGEMSEKAYLAALLKAKESLSETSAFLAEQEAALDKSIAKLEKKDPSHWDKIKQFGDRLDKSVHAAWTVLTTPDD